MKWIAAAAAGLFVPASFAQTFTAPATPKDSPVVLVEQSTSGMDALESAKWVNRSNHLITSYRIGWLTVINGENTFHSGPWITLPAGVKPGATATIPAQGIALDPRATRMIFYVAGVRFADGDQWKATDASIVRAEETLEGPPQG